MQKIKNAFKPDAQKEAEAKKAAEEAEGQQTTTTTTSAADTSTATTATPAVTDPASLESQPQSSIGTGGGLTEPGDSKYGATPGHGISSYQTEKPFHHDDPVGPGVTYGQTLGGAGVGSAPQIGQPDFGGSLSSGTFLASGNHSDSHLLEPEDDASTASIKSGVVGSSKLTGLSLESSTLPDRSVPTTTQIGQGSLETGTHPTFTGNRLDPAFQPAEPGQSRTGYAPVGGATAVTAGGAAAATTAAPQDYTASREVTDNTGTTTGTGEIRERKGLSGLLHRSNPTKLQKEPPRGTTTSSAAPVAPATATPATTAPSTAAPVAAAPVAASSIPAEPTSDRHPSTSTKTGVIPTPMAHETFVRPGYNHEQHIGVDGPIGRPNEVSGAHGTDPRYTSTATEIDKSLDPDNPALLREEERQPTLTERQDLLGEGRVIDPHTGLVKNIGKYGTGAGGTDGAPQITGYDATTQAERLRDADEIREANKDMTWDKIQTSNDGV